MSLYLPSLRPVCETMEERILHSADLAPLLVSDVGNGLALQQSVQQSSANDPVSRSSEIAFVDLSVPDAGALLTDLRAQQAAGRALEIVTIGADQDGLALIGRTLADRSDISAVHVLAHGSDGVLQLGSARLDADSLVSRAAEVSAWANALTADADLLLYGCDFAQSGIGQQMVRDLAILTGADVAASTDLTGAAALGGNWTLEYHSGMIQASVVLSQAQQAQWAGALAIFIADPSYADGASGTGNTGSLRWAISQANAQAGDDTIQLLAGTHRITLVGADNANLFGDLDVTSNISFVGATSNAADTVVRSTVSGERVFDIVNNYYVTVSFSNLTITGGSGASVGGGVNAGGFNTVTMTNVVVTGNSANTGGGISAPNQATLTLNQVTVSGNSANSGGGIHAPNQNTMVLNQVVVSGNNAATGAGLNILGNATLTDVVISGNTATSNGGGLNLQGGLASATLTRVTISGNSAGTNGGGISGAGGTLNASNVTISGNSAGGSGGGLFVNTTGYALANATIANNTAPSGFGGGVYTAVSSYVSVKNTILASNTGGNANMLLTSLGYNADTDGSAVAGGGTDLRPTVLALNLGTLADNGGFTKTHALLSGSVAINAGNPAAPATDQRGVSRVGAPDIGAYESSATNVAPSLDNSRTPVLGAILEDAGVPIGAVGTLVSSLVDFATPSGQVDNVTDPDAGAKLGIAVVGTTTTNGSWYFSLNDGSNWTLLGAVSNTAALLLAADTPSRLYFRPNAHYNGTMSSAITFRAWDQSSGLNGSTTANTSTNGGSSAFSSATDTASLTVLSVNDAPTGTSTSLAVDKNGSRTLVASDFGFADSAGESNAFKSVLVQLPSAGSLRLLGSAITGPTEVTVGQLAAGSLVYTPAAGATGTPYATIGFQVRDDGGTANGGQDLDPTQRTLSIQVVNRVPVITSDGGGASANLFVAENTTAVTTVTGADPDGDAVTFAITGGAQAALFTIDANTGVLRFISAPDFEAPAAGTSNNIYNVVVAIRDNNTPQGVTTQTLAVKVTDVVEGGTAGDLWFTTAANQTTSAGGQTWTQGQVLQYGNAGDSFDINGGGLTNGTVDLLPGFTAMGRTAASPGVDVAVAVRAMHYVQVATLIGTTSGTTNTTTQLNAGDLLLVLDDGGSPVTVNAGTAEQLVVDRKDIVVFRPTTPGNYSVGKYYLLLDDGVKQGGTSYNVHALSLVETSTTVGGVSLNAGTLVVAHSSTAVHNNVYTVKVNSTAKSAISTSGATNATLTDDRVLLLDGSLLGLPGNNNKISGLHVLTAATTFNGTPLAAGTVLVAIDDSNTSGSSYGGVNLNGFDIVALTVTGTGASTAGTAQLLFDGSDLGMTAPVNGFTVVSGTAGNRVPVVNAAIPNQVANEDAPFSFTFASGTFSDADPGDTLTYSAALSAGGALPTWLSFDGAARRFFGTPANGDVGAISVRVTATDPQGASISTVFTLTVTNVNDAPVLDNTKSPVLNALSEDAGAPVGAVGTLVSQLVDFGGPLSNVSDVDASAQTGIAVVAADTSNGSWFYSIDNGSNWLALGPVSDGMARLLAADPASTRLYFQPLANYNGSMASAITFRAWDRSSGANGDQADSSVNGGTTAFSVATDTASLTVTAINDAPVITAPATIIVVEDEATALTTVGFGDVDAAAGSVTVSFTVGAGTLTALTGGGVNVLGSGSLSLTLTGSIADINSFIANGNLAYTTAANATADVALTVTIDDGGNTGADPGLSGTASSEAATRNLTINVIAVNDAPVLDNTRSPVIATVSEDAPAPSGAVGSLVSTLVDFGGALSNVTDADTGAATGIAIIGADTGNGSWFYSINNGASWNALGAVSNTSARLLAADPASTRIYFQPNANFNGTMASAITFRAWDRSSGANGQDMVDTSSNGGSTAFSSATDSAELTVAAVNDAPLNTVPPSQLTARNTPLVFSAAGGNAIQVSDVDAGTLKVTLTVNNGTLALSGTGGLTFSAGSGSGVSTMTFSGSIAAINAALDGLTFTPTTNFTGGVALQVLADDQAATGSGGAMTDTDVVAISVTDASLWVSTDGGTSSSAGSGALTWDKNHVVNFGNPNLALGSGTTSGTFSLVFNISTLAQDGSADVNGLHYVSRAVTVGSTNPINLLAGDVLFTVDGNETFAGLAVDKRDIVLFRPSAPGNYSSGTFQVVLRNPGNTGDDLLDFALVETAVSVGGTNLQAGDFLLLKSGSNDRDIMWFRPTTMGTNPTGGNLNLLINGSAPGINTGGDKYWGLELVQQPLTLGGKSLAAGTLLVSLDGSALAGLNLLSVQAGDIFALDVSVTGVASSATASMVLRAANVGLTGGGERFDAIALAQRASAVPILTLDAGALTYVENSAAASIAPLATVTDADSTQFGGGSLTAFLSANGSTNDRLEINNQGNAAGQIGVVGNAVFYAGAQIGSFSGGTDGGSPLVISLNTNASVAATRDLLRNITYRNVSDDPSTLARTVSVLLSDGSGGVSNIATRSINVTAVNDTPTISAPASIGVTEDVASVISGISFADVDAGSSTVTASFSVASGTLTAVSGAGVTVAGSGGSAVTLSGSIADINTFIAASNLRFTTAANATANVTLDVAIDDGGNTGIDPGLSGTGSSEAATTTVTLTVTAVNDAPTVAAPATIGVTEDVASAITGIVFSDVDAGNSTVTATFSVASGTLTAVSGAGVTVAGSGSAALTLSGSMTDINSFIAASNLRFTTATDATANVTLNVGIDDGGNTGIDPGLSGTASSEAATTTVTLTVTAVNDAPTIAAPATIGVTEDTASAITGIVFSDVDAGTGTVTASFSVASGMLTAASGAGVTVAGSGGAALTLSGSIADINTFIAASNLRFTTATDATANVTLNVGIDDGGNTGIDPGLSGTASSEAATTTVTLTVTAVNDAPTIAAPASIGVTEDTASAITGIVFSDVDAGNSTVTASFSVASGQLTAVSGAGVTVAGSGGNALTLSGSITDINAFIAASNLRFTTASNVLVAVPLAIGINDGGNTGSGGPQSGSGNSLLVVAAVNDAPTVTAPATITVTEGTPSAITGIVFDDVDAGSASVLTTFSVLSGGLSASSGAGVTVGGSATALTLSGSIQDINAFITSGKLMFTTAPGAIADVALGIVINDGGNTGAGLPQSAVGSSTLQVTPLNQAPVVTAPATLSAIEDVASAITGISFSDPDAGNAVVSATFSVGSGTLAAVSGNGVTVSGTGSPVVVLSGSITNINTFITAGNLSFTTSTDATADVALRSAIDDGGNSGVGGARSAFALSTIVVKPVNDAPVLASQWGNQTVVAAQAALLQIPAATFTDPDVGDTLRYVATQADGSPLPAWLRFDPLARSFSGTASVADAGTLTLRVTALDDGGESAQMVFRVFVLAPAPEPVEPDVQPPASAPTSTDSTNTPASAPAEAAAAPAPRLAAEPEIDFEAPSPLIASETTAVDIDTRITVAPQRQFTFDVAATLPVSQADSVLAAALLTQFSDITASSSTDMFTNEDLLRKLEELKRQMLQQESSQQTVLASSIALTSGLSIGYVVWLIRGGILVSSMLSALPAWQLIDPLPVLATTRGNRAKTRDMPAEDPEVEQLFDNKAKAPPKTATTAPATAAPVPTEDNLTR